jgi:hypothetical protein
VGDCVVVGFADVVGFAEVDSVVAGGLPGDEVVAGGGLLPPLQENCREVSEIQTKVASYSQLLDAAETYHIRTGNGVTVEVIIDLGSC